MATREHELIYRGNLSGLGAFNSTLVGQFLITGNLVAIYVRAQAVISFSGNWFIGLKIEGSDVLAGANRPQILSGTLDPAVTGLSIPVGFLDEFQPTVDEKGLGSITGPVIIVLVVDDGLGNISIGDHVGSGTDNSVLYVDPSGDLGQDPTRFAYQETEGNQGSLKLGNVSDTSVDSGIDKSKSLIQVVDKTAYTGNLGYSYFGLLASVVRGGNNSFFQTSAVRGRARYAGSSPDFPVVTGIEAFVDNLGATGGTHSLQALEGNVQAMADANDIQGVAAFGSVDAGKAIAEFAIGILAQMTMGAGSSTPLLAGIRALAGLGGTTVDAVGIFAIISRAAAGVTTNLYGIKIQVNGSTGTVTNSYGIFIPAEIDVGSTIKRAIKSLSTSISEFAGDIHVPDDPYDATTWDANTAVPTKNAVRDRIETLISSVAAALAGLASDSAVVHNTGAENVGGVKTFTSIPLVPDDAYDATTWDGNFGTPTKNALRDKIEAIVSSGSYSDEQAQDAIGAMIDGTLEYIDATPLLRIKDGGVTLAKLANMATASFLGRNTAGTGVPEVLSVTTVRTMLGIADAMTFKGVIDCSANPNYPAADAGDTYKVSVTGKIGGAAGANVTAGDTLYCIADSTASGNQATVGAFWDILETNVDGPVTGPVSSTSGNLASFNGATGKVIQDTGVSIDTDGTLAANSDSKIATQKAIRTYVTANGGGTSYGKVLAITSGTFLN